MKKRSPLFICLISNILAIVITYFCTQHVLRHVGFYGGEYTLFAYIIQVIVIYEGILFFVRGWTAKDKIFLSILYISIVFITLFIRTTQYTEFQHDFNPISFMTSLAADNTSIYQIVVNLLLFVPFPTVLSFYTFKTKYLIGNFLISAFAVEMLQFLTHRGIFDLGDIVLYTIGFFIGLLIYVCLKPRLQRMVILPKT